MANWPSLAEMQSYITQQAPLYGIDPATAVAVARSEGLSTYSQSQGFVGDNGTSFGPFQLHTGGGLGDSFSKIYGAPSADNWKQQIDYSLNYAATSGSGWTPWHGAKNTGIGQYDGIYGLSSPISSSDTTPYGAGGNVLTLSRHSDTPIGSGGNSTSSLGTVLSPEFWAGVWAGIIKWFQDRLIAVAILIVALFFLIGGTKRITTGAV